VGRPTVQTRAATPEDLPTLLALWDELRQSEGRTARAVNPSKAIDLHDRLGSLLVDPECRVVLACADGVPAGMAIMRVARPDPLSENDLVYMPHLVVSRANRRQGVGHALIAAAADYAATLHLDNVAVGVYPALRETNRFYARLGFAPALVHRVAPVSVLRRRLAGGAAQPMLADAMRRRTRLAGAVAVPSVRRQAKERVES
jgi:GNAT superfamily N-acetyltransferase